MSILVSPSLCHARATHGRHLLLQDSTKNRNYELCLDLSEKLAALCTEWKTGAILDESSLRHANQQVEKARRAVKNVESLAHTFLKGLARLDSEPGYWQRLCKFSTR